MVRVRPYVVACILLGPLACGRSTVPEPEAREPPAPPPSASNAAPGLSPRLSRAAPARLVAIGDLHGDLDHARRALRLAGGLDESGRWVGGRLTVVQTGDEVDRGDDDRAILDRFEDWKKQAAAAGGELVALLGNHEIMNASLDFRYVTPAGFETFSSFAGGSGPTDGLAPQALGRAAAFRPGGPYAVLEAGRPLVMKVGDTVFVHGGVLPKHVAYGLDRMNDELDAWLAGQRRDPPAVVVADDGRVWTRAYSGADGDAAGCTELSAALAALGARRMVVGHTVQRGGINSACGGAVWRIDVGLSRYFGGPIEVLEIRGDEVRVLREDTSSGTPPPAPSPASSPRLNLGDR
jgi:hypothetical protein